MSGETDREEVMSHTSENVSARGQHNAMAPVSAGASLQSIIDEEHERWRRTAAKCVFEFRWDADASVWVITSPQIDGLITEASSLPEGLRRAAEVVPELFDEGALHAQ